MKFAALSVFALVSAAIATNPMVEKLQKIKARQTNGTDSEDTAAKMSQFIEILGLTGTPTFSTAVPTCLGGHEPPPQSLYKMILTAVPGSVLGDLANPNGRASISSDFSAGRTPEWYAAMPTEVQSYIHYLKDSKGTGCTTPPKPTGTGLGKAGASGGAGVFVDENGNLATSTSSDFAQATQVAKGGLAGVVAFVGLMAIL